MDMKSHLASGVTRTTRLTLTAAVLLALAVGAQPSAQSPAPARLGGTIGDHVWVEAGPGFGAWFVSGEWSLQVNGESGKADFTASLLGVRSDLWVIQNSINPVTTTRSSHTHHVGISKGEVTSIPNGFKVSGTATITANGSATPYSSAPIEVEITGGNVLQFSNMKVTFLGVAIEHFGSQPYDGVVVLSTEVPRSLQTSSRSLYACGVQDAESKFRPSMTKPA
jgi:hypothetical protein